MQPTSKLSSDDQSGREEHTVPVNCLLVFDGHLEGKSVSIFKDDGCSTNVVSKQFARRKSHLRQLKERSITVSNSNKNTSESATQIVMQGRLRTGPHEYIRKWAVANCRYGVLLGMLWYVQSQSKVNYNVPSVIVDEKQLL